MKLSQNLGKISLGELGWLEIKQAPLCGGFTLRRVGRELGFFSLFFFFFFVASTLAHGLYLTSITFLLAFC